MKSKKILYMLILFAAFACNKTEKAKKRISGVWQIIKYEHTNYSGLTYNYPASGSFVFENCDDEQCVYELNMTYTVDTLNSQKQMSGLYVFTDDTGEFYDLIRISGNDVDTIKKARVLLVTKSDLKTEFTDEYGRHVFIMEK